MEYSINVVFSLVIEHKISKLSQFLTNKKVIVAFSGGVDSTLLLLLAWKFSLKVIPVFFFGPIFTKEELNRASEFCKILKIQLEIIDFNPLKENEFRINPPNRCYFCKKYIMKGLLQVQRELRYDIIVEGTNNTDLEHTRPGFDALQELGIVSPYVSCGISKSDIILCIEHIISHPEWIIGSQTLISVNKMTEFLKNIIKLPSNPCLCSRIDYGVEITQKDLERINLAEKFLRDTFHIPIVRVRLHAHNLARIEILPGQINNILTPETSHRIVENFKDLGFTFVTVDLEGFRSGSLDAP